MARITNGSPLLTSEEFGKKIQPIGAIVPEQGSKLQRFTQGLQLAEMLVNSKAVGAAATLLGKGAGAIKEGVGNAMLKASAAKAIAEQKANNEEEAAGLEKQAAADEAEAAKLKQGLNEQPNTSEVEGYLSQQPPPPPSTGYQIHRTPVAEPAPAYEGGTGYDTEERVNNMRFNQFLQNVEQADQLKKANKEAREYGETTITPEKKAADFLVVSSSDDEDTKHLKEAAQQKIAEIENKRKQIFDKVKNKKVNLDQEQIDDINKELDNRVETIRERVKKYLNVPAGGPAEQSASQPVGGPAEAQAPQPPEESESTRFLKSTAQAKPFDVVEEARQKLNAGGAATIVNGLKQLDALRQKQGGKLNDNQQRLFDSLKSDLKDTINAQTSKAQEKYTQEAKTEPEYGSDTGKGFTSGTAIGTPLTKEQAKLQTAFQKAQAKNPKGMKIEEYDIGPMGAETANRFAPLSEEQTYNQEITAPAQARTQQVLTQAQQRLDQAQRHREEAKQVMYRKAQLPEGVSVDASGNFVIPEKKTLSVPELYSLAAKADTPEKRAQAIQAIENADVPAETLGEMISGNNKRRVAREMLALMPKATKQPNELELQKLNLQLDILRQRYGNAKTKAQQDAVKAEAKKAIDDYNMIIKRQEAGMETPEQRAERKATSGGTVSGPEATVWAKLHPSPTSVYVPIDTPPSDQTTTRSVGLELCPV
jgi:hypothetical protein